MSNGANSQPIMVPTTSSSTTPSDAQQHYQSASRRTQSESQASTATSASSSLPAATSTSLGNDSVIGKTGAASSSVSPLTTNRSVSATEERRSRRGSSQVQPILTKPNSSETLTMSGNSSGNASATWLDAPGPPLSPGLLGSMSLTTGENSPKVDTDKLDSSFKLTRKESYKAQRKTYRMEKKRVADELLNSLKDPTVIVMGDWLKVRGTLKSWTKLWCVLKPGLLILYKSQKTKSNHWVGTVLLNICQVIERPSKKDGFCFKLFHPMEQSIWGPKGPEKEGMGAVVLPLPTAYLIFRAPSQAAGKCWLDALELSMRCSSLIVRSTSIVPRSPQHDTTTTHETQWSEADCEKHFVDHDLEDCISQPENGVVADDVECSASDSESEDNHKEDKEEDDVIKETPYVTNESEVFGTAGEVVTVLQEEQKSLIWYLMKQVRPGMDLSKVVLPTFILEPRSFLEKLADSYYHANLLSQAVLEDDALTRMKGVVKWYLSGFYKKPQGLKKPYNPLLGETFRCYWQHDNGSRTFYLAEQLSHHPPVSGFYVTNRQDGYTISATIIAKSKFYGNSTSAVLDGVAVLTMLPRGESYTMTIPYAHCKGIIVGTLSMELGGKVNINCEKTGYNCELEFKLKPFIGGADQLNMVVGRIKLGKETLASISGYWDGQINITDKRTEQETVFFHSTPEVRMQRLKKYTVPLDHQGPWESEKLWLAVTNAINNDDQEAATQEKTKLEEAQRARANERKMADKEWIPKYFVQDIITGNWVYRHADIRPWDPRNDVLQYEQDYIIKTKTRHKTPIMRTGSIVSIDPQSQVPLLMAESRSSLSVLKSSKRQLTNNHPHNETVAHDSASSSDAAHSDSSQSAHKRRSRNQAVTGMFRVIDERLEDQLEEIKKIHRILEQQSARRNPLGFNFNRGNGTGASRIFRHVVDTFIIVLIVLFVQWFTRRMSGSSGGGDGNIFNKAKEL
ncbi:oxysterol-binding protein-related protein 8 [Trichogramma pretiosum]|uniref:oxysterol-binding protein-related protein 8 n=1 Tax=Trichogramma pretiosum TaxID=7493 RepID=UPI0006C98260|nr:oxysterol-binding protein-related protein 8 [Trichogramma pretiosum]